MYGVARRGLLLLLPVLVMTDELPASQAGARARVCVCVCVSVEGVGSQAKPQAVAPSPHPAAALSMSSPDCSFYFCLNPIARGGERPHTA